MKADPSETHIMPLIMGPLRAQAGAQGAVYKEVENVELQFETDRGSIAELLPDCFQPAEKPVVTVVFVCNDGVDFMAGRGYRIATVMVGVRFDGEEDHTEGSFALVMFEDDTLPILLGRERLGVA